MGISAKETIGSLTALWGSWPTAHRLGLVALVVVVSGGLLLWSGIIAPGSRMVPLFGRLEPRDASAITASLDEMGISYRLDDSGRTILVPGSDVERLRLHFAGEGLPAGGVVGFEIMDEAAWATTEFGRKVSYVRALQGELTRTISHMDGVETARVHIVIPQSTLFVRDEKAATAAVMLTLRPSFTPDPGQTRGIMHLVASAVDDLKAENVTVIDGMGRILSADAWAGDALNRRGAQTDATLHLEGVLESRVQSLLDQVLGPGNSVVRVNASLNFDEQIVERQFFEPAANGQGYVRSAHEVSESYAGAGTAPGGAGIDANVPTYQLGGEDSNEYQRTETTYNYELQEIRETLVAAPGAVSRLSVAVVVNGLLEEPQRLALMDTVATAAGIDPGRGDQITVTGQPFDTSLWDRLQDHMEIENAARQAWETQIRQTIQWAAIGLGALILVLVPLFLVRRRKVREVHRLEEIAAKRVQVQAAKNGERLTMSLDTVPEDEQMKRAIEQLARDDPSRVAEALRVWLAED